MANKSLIAIADTEAIPTDPMVVSSDLEAPLKASLQSAMTNMHNDEEGKKLLALLYESRGIERYITEAEVQEIIRLGDGE
ncbi:MAG: PhnD/SsuA/transferrin family substrate-binding protein [Anaerolineae bacterium]